MIPIWFFITFALISGLLFFAYNMAYFNEDSPLGYIGILLVITCCVLYIILLYQVWIYIMAVSIVDIYNDKHGTSLTPAQLFFVGNYLK